MQRLKNSSLVFKFSVMQFTYWAMWSCFYSFAGMFFSGRGMSYTMIGIAMSVSVLSGIMGQFFWGFLCDRLHSIKKIFVIANLATCINIFLLYKQAGGISTILLMATLGFLMTPQPAVLDSWILCKSNIYSLNYGFIRMWASIGYSVFAFTVGVVIRYSGYIIMPVFTALFTLITIAAALATPDISNCDSTSPNTVPTKESYRRLLSNKNYLLFLISCFLVGFGLQTMDNLMPIIVETAGGGSNHLGFIIFASAITEVPFFLLSSKIQSRFSHRACLSFAIAVFIVQLILMAQAFSPAMLALGMAFQGIGFAVFLPSIRFFAVKNAPPDLSTSAQTITDSVTTGVAGTVASFIGGIVIQHFGSISMFILCLILTWAAFIITVVGGKEKEAKKDISKCV